MTTGTTAVLLIPAALLLGNIGFAVVRRPQRGLLVIAALLPFDGLLLIVPGGDGVVIGAWKEAALVGTLLATFVAPKSTRRGYLADGTKDPDGGRPVARPVWVPAALAFVAISVVSAVAVGGVIAGWGLKIDVFYLLVPLVLWRCPFTASDRDRLVSILMAAGVLTAGYGLLQQVLGAERLVALGYEYNTAVRFSGGLLRSFSSFTQPFSFGLFLTMVLLICLPVAMADARRTRNTLFLAVSPFLVVGMAASVVRGATLGLLAGIVVLVAWRFRGLAHAFVPALIAVTLVPVSVITAYFSSSSLGERTNGWTLILERVVIAPLGNGIGTTGAAAEKSAALGADPDRLITTPQGQLYLPDNQYVKTVLEFGPIGLWVLVLLLGTVISTAVVAARRTRGDDQALAQGIAASVVGAAAASTVSTYLEIFPLDFYFWLMAGLLLCLDHASTSTRSLSAPAAAASRPMSASSSGR